MNLGPSGYEPDELPDCSTPRHSDRDVGVLISGTLSQNCAEKIVSPAQAIVNRCVVVRRPSYVAGNSDPRFTRLGSDFGRPGGVLLSRILRYSTISAEAFHGRVRDGIGCFILAITTRSSEIRPTRGAFTFEVFARHPLFARQHGSFWNSG